MATIFWTGNQRATARTHTVQITGITAGQTVIATINGKAETYTSATADEPTAAGELAAALSASLLLELKNFTFTASGDTLTATGPADGMPVEITWSGTATVSTSTVTPTSPHDAADDENYSGGAKPVNGDTLVFENTPASCLYNLGQFTANTVAVVKRASYGGQIGLADTNPLGYPEYLATHFETAGTAHTVEDNAAFVRLKFTSASAVTVTATGPGGGQVNQETVELTGTAHASSVLNVTGAAVAVAPLTSQSAAFGTVRVANGVLRTGPSAALTNVTISNSQAELAGSYTTLFMDRNSGVTVTRAAAAGTSTNNQGGTLTWRSTGTLNATTLGSDAVLDVSQAPTSVTVSGITMAEGATLNNPFDRITRPYTVTLAGELGRVTIDIGSAQNFTVN